MIEKKIDKVKGESKPRDDGIELENQFIMRLPEEVARHLHEALQTGNLKDRMTIKMETELRYGEVRFDQWFLYTKIVDLPTVIECLKTIDNKNFYKSADICQLMICKEEPEEESEKESPTKGKKKDPTKVDKKYLWPHGITPPCKNVRKRRFRKTLKKKNVEAPEIEKEVKRLLRVDNDAVRVDFEIISEDVDKRSLDQQAKEYNDGDEEYNDDTLNGYSEKTMNDNSSQKDINIESDDEDDNDARPSTSAPIGGVGEHDIFGEEVSSSDDDDHESQRVREMDETSRLSADDSRMSDYSMGVGAAASQNDSQHYTQTTATEFSKSMFGSPKEQIDDSTIKFEDSSSNLPASTVGYDDDYSNDPTSGQMSVEQINNKITELRRQYKEFKMQHTQKAQEISSIQNPTLKQRMQETLDNLLAQMLEKELEIKDYENML